MRHFLFATAICAATIALPAKASTLFGFSEINPNSNVYAEYLLINDTIRIDADNAGWFTNNGEHQGNNDNYAISDYLNYKYDNININGELRNYLAFSLAAISAPITSAVVRIFHEPNDPNPLPGEPFSGASSFGLPATWTLFDVSREPDYRLEYTNATAIFDDLGAGLSYGNVIVTPNPKVIEVALNGNALTALNANLGKRFAVGGTLRPSISAVPETATWMTMLIGFGIVGFALRLAQRTRFATSA